MHNNLITISFKFDINLVLAMDRIIDNRGYVDREDYIRDVLRRAIDKDLRKTNYKKLDLNRIDPKDSDIKSIKKWLDRTGLKRIKTIVSQDYREENFDEINELLIDKTSKNKILALYGYRIKDYVFKYKR